MASMGKDYSLCHFPDELEHQARFDSGFGAIFAELNMT